MLTTMGQETTMMKTTPYTLPMLRYSNHWIKLLHCVTIHRDTLTHLRHRLHTTYYILRVDGKFRCAIVCRCQCCVQCVSTSTVHKENVRQTTTIGFEHDTEHTQILPGRLKYLRFKIVIHRRQPSTTLMKKIPELHAISVNRSGCIYVR